MITFSGIDGSGKSTLAQRTVAYLKGKGCRAVKVDVYAGSSFLSIGRLLGSLSGKARKSLENNMNSPRRGAGKVLDRSRIIFFFVDIAVFAIKLAVLRVRKIVPVCDRYLYDTLVHLRYRGLVGEKFFFLMLKLIPGPEKAFLLELDPVEAEKREKEHLPEYYRSKAAFYEDLSGPAGLVSVDTSGERDAVWEKVRLELEKKRCCSSAAPFHPPGMKPVRTW
ncbi:MAG: hypothetical protein GF408_02850 [Candidatus Omnitrophica bacterium]|nr:hypothetical protein [Candidatus Omnitrophota bacterium]